MTDYDLAIIGGGLTMPPEGGEALAAFMATAETT